jgi:hypothetical protein
MHWTHRTILALVPMTAPRRQGVWCALIVRFHRAAAIQRGNSTELSRPEGHFRQSRSGATRALRQSERDTASAARYNPHS